MKSKLFFSTLLVTSILCGCSSATKTVQSLPSPSVESKAETGAVLQSKKPTNIEYVAQVTTESGDFDTYFKFAHEWHNPDPELDTLYQRDEFKIVTFAIELENKTYQPLYTDENGLPRYVLTDVIGIYDSDGFRCEQLNHDPLVDGMYSDTWQVIPQGTKRRVAYGYYVPKNIHELTIAIQDKEITKVTIE